MNNYLKLLEQAGIVDPEQALDMLEKMLKENQGEVRASGTVIGRGVRVLEKFKKNRLTGFGAGINFEKGLKNLIGKIECVDDELEVTSWHGETKPNSPIDEWLLNGNKVDIKKDKGNGFVVCAKMGSGFNSNDFTRNAKTQIYEASAKKLSAALGWFNKTMPEINYMSKSGIAQTMMGGSEGFRSNFIDPKYTIRHEVSDDRMGAEVKGI